MEKPGTSCPVCTLYLREGITLQAHLETHPKEQVIEALLKATNGGSKISQTVSATAGPFMQSQSYGAPGAAFVAQPPQYVNPQTQMTTAVTYQHFMTSNGSPAIMPQYVQVPAIISPNSNYPLVANQSINYVPNQNASYAHTIYNPLYNPYIPQPYPLPQPVFTGYPAANSNAQISSSQQNTVLNSQSNLTRTNTVLQKCSIATNTTSVTEMELSDSKSERSTPEPRSPPAIIRRKTRPKTKAKTKLRPKTKAKAKPIQRSKSKVNSKPKSKFGPYRLIAPKGFDPSSVSMDEVPLPLENGDPGPSKTSVITRARSSKTKSLSPSTSSSGSSSSGMISPPPLTLINRSRSSSASFAETPPPPPLAPAPGLIALPKQENCLEFIKSEDVDVAQNTAVITEASTSSITKVAEYLRKHHDVNGSNSVIVESNIAAQRNFDEMNHINNNHHEYDGEETFNAVQTLLNSVVISKDDDQDQERDPLETEDHENLLDGEDLEDEKEPDQDQEHEQYEDQEQVEEDEEEEEEEEEEREEEEEEEREEEEEEEEVEEEEEEEEEEEINLHEELNKRLINSLEVGDEKKISFVFDAGNQDIPHEISSANIERNCDGSDIFIQQENIPFSDIHNGRLAGLANGERCSNANENEGMEQPEDNFEENYNAESYQQEPCDIPKYTDLQPVKYADLQSSTATNVLQDMSLDPRTFNNYMEVDGIRIFFNNHPSTQIPLEPIIKFTSNANKGDPRNFPGYLKTESPLAESVIQLVTGSAETRNFNDGYAATTSNSNDGHLDLPDLSPLTLNIQADESMPARGELSEQESLGADNSNWGLFHSENRPEEWKHNLDIDPLQEDNVEAEETVKKSFKCSLCDQIFSCPKERRVHKNTAHLGQTKSNSAVRKTKNFQCVQCNQVFVSIRERRLHTMEYHAADGSAKPSEIKEECNVKNEEENNNANIKNELHVKCERPEGIIQPGFVSKACVKCDLVFNSLKKLREHLRELHGIIRFKCESCSSIFDDESDYNAHLEVHPLVCNKCGKTFHRKPNLSLHMKRHLDIKPYECSLCPKSFITRQKLEEHMNGHSGIKPIKCNLCDKTFSRHSNLIQHRNMHHLKVKKKIKDYVCRCGEVFHSLRKLEWHKEVHDAKPKPCPYCTQKFIHSASVTRHVRRAHEPDYLPGDNREFENIQCPICEKIYLRSSLVVHMRVHNGEKPFVCKICNKCFSTKWNLELHNWTHQSRSNMPFKCSVCKSAFFRESDYIAHMNSHKNFKPFTCNICGQKFIRKYNCLRHQEEHRRAKRFVCTVSGCEKSFHRSYYLKDHMKVHTGVRPHTCHICGKASSTKSNHNKHVRIHDTREPINTEN